MQNSAAFGSSPTNTLLFWLSIKREREKKKIWTQQLLNILDTPPLNIAHMSSHRPHFIEKVFNLQISQSKNEIFPFQTQNNVIQGPGWRFSVSSLFSLCPRRFKII